MSDLNVENILNQIAQLPPGEQSKLWRLWEERQTEQPQNSFPATPDRRVPSVPQPDYRPALRWLAEHARDYAGQWVALDGDRLIAHDHDAQVVYAAARADGAYLPLVTQVEDPQAAPYIGI